MASSVRDLRLEMKDKEQIVLRIYNPDNEDFTVNYDNKAYTVHSKEIETFSYIIGDHVRKHLAIHLVNKRGVKTNELDERKVTEKEITINL